MSRGWLLGGRWHTLVEDLATRPGCTWHLVKQAPEESPWLLQLWSPKPTDRELDQIRATYLQRFSDAETMDPTHGAFGYNDHSAWFLQKLEGEDLQEAWRRWGEETREMFLRQMHGALVASGKRRFVDPSVIRLRPGRIQVPILIGQEAPDVEGMSTKLLTLGDPGTDDGPQCWDQPLPLADLPAAPIRGRAPEMTYLKSIIMGLAASGMERIIIVSGEEGLGHEEMVNWSCAVAETEGLWITRYTVEHNASAGTFLAPLLQDLLAGFEPDFYSKHPEGARLLSKRLPSFALLRGGRKSGNEPERFAPNELEAALLLLNFAQTVQHRLIVVENLERADPSLQEALATLTLRADMGFIFSYTTGNSPEPEEFLTRIKGVPEVAYLSLNKIEERQLLELISDYLGHAKLPGDYKRNVMKACLGNPGLLKTTLELAQLDGVLVWQNNQWEMGAINTNHIKLQENHLTNILKGRLQKLDTVSVAIIRSLSLMEWPLEINTLGKAIGIAGDPLEEAVRNVLSAKLAQSQRGKLAVASPKVQELALKDCPPNDVRRLARALLKALQEAAGRPVLSVHLQTLASSDERSVLSQVMAAIEQEPPPPMEAEVFVRQAMELSPTALQRAKLWEFLSDAWALGYLGERAPLASLGERSCYEFALEALGLAKAALDESPERSDTFRENMARILRKKADLHTRMRDHALALKSVHTATGLLAEHPHHPEQVKLALVTARIRQLEGFHNKGLQALEAGMALLETESLANDHEDRLSLMLALGEIQTQKCQFELAITTLEATQRLLETHPNPSKLSRSHKHLAVAGMAMGKPEMALSHIRDAIGCAQRIDDMVCLAECHFMLGCFRSLEDDMQPALRHLDNAKKHAENMVDKVGKAMASAWQGRTFAAMGQAALADEAIADAIGISPDRLTAAERGELAFLQAEIAAFRDDKANAARLYWVASEIFEGAGLTWWDRLAKLRFIYTTALKCHEVTGAEQEMENAWTRLENIKGHIEGSGSRWLELEWHRAHGKLLSIVPQPNEAILSEALRAWGEVQRTANELRLQARALEACTEAAFILLQQNEKLGAKSRTQDAFCAFQALWSKVPENHGQDFLERPDIHYFRKVVDLVGMRFEVPERVFAIAEWTPTRITTTTLDI